MMTNIDLEIDFEGVQYSMFAVGYRGEEQFIAWIKVQNENFEYDGCVR
jgi:hypothetical protein